MSVGSTPQFDAPALAALSRQLHERPLWQTREAVPLEVNPHTWQRANNEMREAMERQGRLVAAADIGKPNFLLFGIPVVMNDV
jgi:hypothetical protein